MNGRVLAVDPGEKNLGVAVSDPTATIANPHSVIRHVGREADAAAIAGIAKELNVVTIVVGQAVGMDGDDDRPQARHAQKVAEAIRSQVQVPVVLWDESGSTQKAREARRAMGVRRKKLRGHMDDLAAVVILQSYLDAHFMSGEGTHAQPS